MRTILVAIILALICAGIFGMATLAADAPGVVSLVGAVVIGAAVCAFAIALMFSKDSN